MCLRRFARYWKALEQLEWPSGARVAESSTLYSMRVTQNLVPRALLVGERVSHRAVVLRDVPWGVPGGAAQRTAHRNAPCSRDFCTVRLEPLPPG